VNDQIRALAASEGATLVDLYEAFLGRLDVLLGEDGLHPNVAGYEAMAQTFFTGIRDALEAGTATASPALNHHD
jgi:lysophospholipase L1-like esterase